MILVAGAIAIIIAILVKIYDMISDLHRQYYKPYNPNDWCHDHCEKKPCPGCTKDGL